MTNLYRPVSRPGIGRGPAVDPAKCEASVDTAGVLWRSHQCPRKWKVTEDGHHWCSQHAPSAEKARSDAAYKNYVAKAQASPGIQLGYALRRVRKLEQAIDDYVDSRISLQELQAIRLSSSDSSTTNEGQKTEHLANSG